jgi:hypothetical protein
MVSSPFVPLSKSPNGAKSGDFTIDVNWYEATVLFMDHSPHVFSLRNLKPQVVRPGGSRAAVDASTFPMLRGLSLYRALLNPLGFASRIGIPTRKTAWMTSQRHRGLRGHS